MLNSSEIFVGLRSHWYIACSSQALKKKPISAVILGTPLVLFRGLDNRAVALEDRCAHRNVPLSSGRVCQGELECPYHGWRYGHEGEVSMIPAIDDADLPLRMPKIRQYPCLEQDGYLWVCLDEQPVQPLPRPFPHLEENGWTSFRMETRFKAGVEICLENFLDCPHATYVHRFWFRAPKARRTRAVVTSLADGVVAEYFDEPREDSLVWWLLSDKNSQMRHTDRYLVPTTTRVDYVFDDQRHYIITSVCTPVDEKTTQVHTIITFKFGAIGWFIRLFFAPLSQIIIGQDVRILGLQQANLERFEESKYCIMPTDLLALQIHQWLQALRKGSSLPHPQGSRELFIHL
jgi:phenylpropionate dioxygenase-like ring-hydroxylating dioxygenase large terminal subunit